MKTKEELNALKEEELAQVTGGQAEVFPIPGSEKDFNNQAEANDRPIKILN